MTAPRKQRRADNIVFARRMRLLQEVLGLSDQQAAADCGVTLVTYRRYMTGAPMRTMPVLRFCHKHRVWIEWLICGHGDGLQRHLAVNPGGKIAILPIRPVERWPGSVAV